MRVPTPQLACLITLVLSLILGLPGLYYETELPPSSTGTLSHYPFPVVRVPRRPGIRTLNGFDSHPGTTSPVLVRTTFELRELSDADRRSVERRLRVDVNESSASRLTKIDGVGPVTARRIILRRRSKGAFESVRDLLSVPGIGPATLRDLDDDILISGRLVDPANGVAAGTGPLDINRASARRLTALPGIGPVLARRIIEFRNRSGPFQNGEELRTIPGIGPMTIARLRDRVEY